MWPFVTAACRTLDTSHGLVSCVALFCPHRIHATERPVSSSSSGRFLPGAGFGSCGEGYFRLSAFGLRENVEEAVERIRTRLAL